MTTGIRKPGDFCWINILTPDPTAARDFFARLLEWTYVEIPGMGHRIQVGGRDVGALFDLASPPTPPGTPPGIGVMVKVEHADTTAERARALGGTAKPAFDIGPQGRMAECHDPTGANIDVWQGRNSPGTDVDTALHGAPSWFEVLTTDMHRARAFYTALFGWTAEAMPMGDVDYTVFNLDGAPVAGMMAITPEMGDVPPHWGTYFTARDVDAAARGAEALGASIFLPPQAVPGVGRFAGVRSPQGVHFYVIRYSSPA
jgi:predicted enzyme related to lactoylglutathione lyase